jgi:hypothetical protein
MKSAPNHTVVTGTLRACALAADGYGGDVEIEVVANESPDPNGDFIKPALGQVLRAFCPPPDLARTQSLVGRRVRVQLTFLGGPSGGRAVVQSLKAG